MAVSPTHGRTKNIPNCFCCGSTASGECCYEPYGEDGVNHAMALIIWNHDGHSDDHFRLRIYAGSLNIDLDANGVKGVATGAFDNQTLIYSDNNMSALHYGSCYHPDFCDPITKFSYDYELAYQPLALEPGLGALGIFWHHPDQDDILASNFDQTHPANSRIYYEHCFSHNNNGYKQSDGDHQNIVWRGPNFPNPINRTDWEYTFYTTVGGATVFRNTVEIDMRPLTDGFMYHPLGFSGAACNYGHARLACFKKSTRYQNKATDIANFFSPWIMVDGVEYGAAFFPQDSDGNVEEPWILKPDHWYVVRDLDTMLYSGCHNISPSAGPDHYPFDLDGSIPTASIPGFHSPYARAAMGWDGGELDKFSARRDCRPFGRSACNGEFGLEGFPWNQGDCRRDSSGTRKGRSCLDLWRQAHL